MSYINDPLINFDFFKDTLIPSYTFDYNQNIKKIVLVVVVELNGSTQRYDPFIFLNIILMSYYKRIDKIKELDKRITLIYDCKMMLINYIDVFIDEIDRANAPIKIYDFSRTIKQVDGVIDKLRLELEVNKYSLDIKKLRQETNGLIRALPYILSALALLVSVVSIWINYHKAQSTPQKVQIEIVKEK